MARSVLLLVAVVLAAQASSDAGGTPQNARMGSLAGMVVDATSSLPVAGARVALRGPVQAPPVLTDAAGAFEFPMVPGGVYSVDVQRDGYRSSTFPDNSTWVRQPDAPIVVLAGERRAGVTVPLGKGGSIAGAVLDAGGRPLAAAQVSVLGATSAALAGRATTDELGRYSVTGLAAGAYVVCARLRPPSNEPADRPSTGPVPACYPNATHRDHARDVIVAANAAVAGTDVRLADAAASILDLGVTRADGEAVTFATGHAMSLLDRTSYVLRFAEGRARVALPPGEYEVTVQSPSGRANTSSTIGLDLFALTRISVAGSGLETANLILGSGASVAGRVVFEGDGTPPSPPAVVPAPLAPALGQSCRQGPVTIAPDWSFRVEGLAGACRAGAFPPLSAGWSPKAVMLRGRDVLDESVRFEPGRHYDNVTIVMTGQLSQLRARAEDAGAPTGEFAVVAFPVLRERWKRLERWVKAAAPARSLDQASTPGSAGGDPGRSVRLLGLAAGDYYVIAIDNIRWDATRDPGVLDKLIPAATRVTLPAGQLIEVSLPRRRLADLVR